MYSSEYPLGREALSSGNYVLVFRSLDCVPGASKIEGARKY